MYILLIERDLHNGMILSILSISSHLMHLWLFPKIRRCGTFIHTSPQKYASPLSRLDFFFSFEVFEQITPFVRYFSHFLTMPSRLTILCSTFENSIDMTKFRVWLWYRVNWTRLSTMVWYCPLWAWVFALGFPKRPHTNEDSIPWL